MYREHGQSQGGKRSELEIGGNCRHGCGANRFRANHDSGLLVPEVDRGIFNFGSTRMQFENKVPSFPESTPTSIS